MQDQFAFVFEDGSGRPNRNDMTLIHSHSMKVLSMSATSNLMYPVERCIDLHKVDDYVRWLSEDPGFVHITLFTTCAIDDFVLRQSPSSLTLQHLRKAPFYLKLRLDEREGYKADTTLIVVMALAFMATMFEDFDVVTAHIEGMQQLVRLRGGHRYLMSNPKTYFQIERIQLSWCLAIGRAPLFFPAPVSWDSFFPGSQPTPSGMGDLPLIDQVTGPRLAGVFRDLQYLATLINMNDENGTIMDAGLFQNAVHSIQTRLLAIQSPMGAGCGIAECMRLGMLAVLSTTFRLPTRKMPHPFLASRLQSALHQSTPNTDESRMMLAWVCMMSVLAVFEANEPWVSTWWQTFVTEVTWDVMKSMLQRLIRIQCIHDELGQKVFMQLEHLRHVSA